MKNAFKIVVAALVTFGTIGAAPAAADGYSPPSLSEIAANLGVTVAELEERSGLTADELRDGIRGLTPTSRFGGEVGGPNVAGLTTMGAHDWGGPHTCTGYGERAAPGAGDNTWSVFGRHRVTCSPLVYSSYCSIMVYFPNNPNYPVTQEMKSGGAVCDVSKWGFRYGWNLQGNMKGYWGALASAFWINNYPRSCFTAQTFIHCAFNTEFDIPGLGYPYDTFNWAPSGD